MRPSEDTILLVCLTVGAVAGFTLTGGAAVGTAVGAGVGIAAGWLMRQRQEGRDGHGTPA